MDFDVEEKKIVFGVIQLIFYGPYELSSHSCSLSWTAISIGSCSVYRSVHQIQFKVPWIKRWVRGAELFADVPKKIGNMHALSVTIPLRKLRWIPERRRQVVKLKERAAENWLKVDRELGHSRDTPSEKNIRRQFKFSFIMRINNFPQFSLASPLNSRKKISAFFFDSQIIPQILAKCKFSFSFNNWIFHRSQDFYYADFISLQSFSAKFCAAKREDKPEIEFEWRNPDGNL